MSAKRRGPTASDATARPGAPTGRSRGAKCAVLLTCVLLLTGCASLRPSGNALQTALPHADDSTLGRIAARSVPGDASGLRPLPQSRYSMDARLALAARAERSLDLQYYLLQNDATGRQLLLAVRDAARRGVRVRILVDDLYTARSDRLLDALDAFPNIEVRVFNPFPAGRAYAATRWAFSLFDLARVNHRMHNKLFIADGSFAVLGGRNIADEYFFQSREGNFVDFDLLVAGRVVGDLERSFDDYWNSPRVYRLAALEPRDDGGNRSQRAFDEQANGAGPFTPPPVDALDIFGRPSMTQALSGAAVTLEPAWIRVVADDPEKVGGKAESGRDDSTVTAHVLAALEEARSDVLLVSPYFVPGARGIEAIEALRARGVKVTLLTNTLASNDEPYASVAYARYRKRMLRAGVEIHEIGSSRLRTNEDVGPVLGTTIGRSHAKLVVVDHRLTFVGSMNMDLRSSRENTEIGAFIDSEPLAGEVLALTAGLDRAGSYRVRFKSGSDDLQWVATEGGHEIVYEDEPEVDVATRLKAIFIAPFIGEGLL